MSDARALDPVEYGVPWIEAVGPYLEFWLAAGAAAIMFLASGGEWHAAPWERDVPLHLDPALAALGLVLIVATYVLRAVRTGRLFRFVPIDLALGAFVGSAAVGVWAAYERQAAVTIFFFLLAGVALYHAVRNQPERSHLLAVLVFWGLFGALFSLAFLFSTDWQTYADKIPYLDRVTVYVRRLIPARSDPFVNSNDAGGILALVLPAYLPLLAYRHDLLTRGRKLWTAFWSLAALVVAAGWLLSVSRGAWAGLLVACGLWVAWRAAGSDEGESAGDRVAVWRRQMRVTAICFVVGLALTGAVGFLVLAGRLPGTAALNGRLNLWSGGLLLARDYRIVGGGLGTFAMPYSLYTLLINVGYIFSSHNLVVDVLYEQGAIGLAAAVAFGIGTLVLGLRNLRSSRSRRSQRRWVVEASLVGLFAIVIHGAVQNVFYGSPAGMLLAVPLGLVANAWRHTAETEWAPAEQRSASGAAWAWGLAGAALVIVLGLGIWQRRALLGAWYTNLGAISQARVELSVYDSEAGAGLTIDQVRQQEDLSYAEALYVRAIAADPANPSPRLRLTNIYLALGRYDEALRQAQAVWDAGHRDAVTRLLYGDALVAAGRTDEAAECVKGVPFSVERLQAQGWERYYPNEDYRRAADAWYTVMLLDPEDANAVYWYDEARALLGDEN